MTYIRSFLSISSYSILQRGRIFISCFSYDRTSKMPYTEPQPTAQMPQDEIYSPPIGLEDKHTELLQARAEESQDILPFQMCAPRLYIYVKCRCVTERHCPIGQSFQQGQHHVCTYNAPPEPQDVNARLRGLCPSCQKSLLENQPFTESEASSSVDKTVEEGEKRPYLKKLKETFVCKVNMHGYPNEEWTSSMGSHRICKYHCEECKLKDRLFRIEIEADGLERKLDNVQTREDKRFR
ncbi:hypothetical protein BJ875DRAFT_31475 [Amylocarpus encephaloides]|uniref:Uncharacterized protein n=1 Tax=Amylocarpus encephaloides TaxID=45428 RepID=A0A9P7YIJ4_9HELO|nr:hypothetical protein BJ875DRAFT_31475 [Amylocarpus encephaloides]